MGVEGGRWYKEDQVLIYRVAGDNALRKVWKSFTRIAIFPSDVPPSAGKSTLKAAEIDEFFREDPEPPIMTEPQTDMELVLEKVKKDPAIMRLLRAHPLWAEIRKSLE